MDQEERVVPDIPGLTEMVAQCYYCLGDKPIMMWLEHELDKDDSRFMGCLDIEPCERCRSFMHEGVMLISVKNDSPGEMELQQKSGIPFPDPYRTGNYVVVTEELAQKIASGCEPNQARQLLYGRWAFVQDVVWKSLGLPTVEEDDDDEPEDD